MTRNEKDIEFAKETHIALNDPRWEWTGSTLFSDVWCWLPISYDMKHDYSFSIKIGFTSTGQRLFMTGQRASFFIRISSLYIDDANWSYVVDLDVAAESVSINDLIESSGKAAYELLAKHRQEINRRKAEALRKRTNEMYRLDLVAWKGTSESKEYLLPELHFSRSSAIKRFKQKKRWWAWLGKHPCGCSLLTPKDEIEYLS